MNAEFDKLQIVVARYKEQLIWLKEDPFNKYSVVVYNKGGDDNYYKSPNIVKEVVLPNSGLEVHSFLYHIINNYDNLANITAFFQGSIELPYKYNRAAATVNESVNRNTTILAACGGRENIRLHLYDFTLDSYKMSHPTVDNNGINHKLHPCKIRPFGRWYEALFGDIVTTNIAYNHVIAIKREHILRRPKDFYQKLITFVEDIDIGIQPEAVHYFERAWEAIFYPLDDNNYLTQMQIIQIK